MALNTYGTLKTEVSNELKTTAFDGQIPEAIERAEDWMYSYPEFRVRAMEGDAEIILPKYVNITAANVGGTGDAITLTNESGSTISSYSYGLAYSFEVESNNTTAVTINVDSQGAKNLKKGYNATEDLAANDLKDGGRVYVFYDGTQFRLVPRGSMILPSDYLGWRRVYINVTPIRELEFLSPGNFWGRYLADETSKPQAFTIEGDQLIAGPSPDQNYFGKMLYWKRFAALSSDSDTNWILTNARGLYFYPAVAEMFEYLGDMGRALNYRAKADVLIQQVIGANKFDRFGGGGAIVQKSDVAIL